jgi:hypothetical protein
MEWAYRNKRWLTQGVLFVGAVPVMADLLLGSLQLNSRITLVALNFVIVSFCFYGFRAVLVYACQLRPTAVVGCANQMGNFRRHHERR